MLCSEALDCIMLFLDKELDSQNEALLKDHLKECEECRKEYELLRSILIKSSEIGKNPPEELREGVMKKIRRDKRKTLFRTMSAVAAAAVLVIAVTLNFDNIITLSGLKKAEKANLAGAPEKDLSDDNVFTQKGDTGGKETYDQYIDRQTEAADSNSAAIAGSSTAQSAENRASAAPDFSALPFGVLKAYHIEDTFKYGYLIDYEKGALLTKRSEFTSYTLNEPHLLVTTLTMEELDKLLNELNIPFTKNNDYKSYSMLKEDAKYGFIMLQKQAQ